MNARRATIKEPVPLEDERTDSEKEADLQAEDNDKTQEPYEDPTPGDEPEPWHPGRACLNCGATDYRLTVGWGQACDKCLVPNED